MAMQTLFIPGFVGEWLEFYLTESQDWPPDYSREIELILRRVFICCDAIARDHPHSGRVHEHSSVTAEKMNSGG